MTWVSWPVDVSATILDEPPITKLISSDSVSLNLSYASSISPAVRAESAVPPVRVSIVVVVTAVYADVVSVPQLLPSAIWSVQ